MATPVRRRQHQTHDSVDGEEGDIDVAKVVGANQGVLDD
jgi:hypothetical protein